MSSHLWCGVPWFDVVGWKDSSLSSDHPRPPIAFFPRHHDDVTLLETQVPLFIALVGVHGHVFCMKACRQSEWREARWRFSKLVHICVCYLHPTLKALLGRGRGVFHWAGFPMLLFHWETQRDKKKNSLNTWNNSSFFMWAKSAGPPCTLGILPTLSVQSHNITACLKLCFVSGKNSKLFDILSVFGACCCCWNTRGRRRGGGDELHITFGEPASLSSLQFTQPPHVLLLQHCYYLHQIKSSVITIKTQQKEKEIRNQEISTSFLLKFRWFSFLALQGYKAWAWRPSTFSPWETQRITAVTRSRKRCKTREILFLSLPVPVREKERNPSSWWREWRQSVAAAVPRERSEMDSDWPKRSATRPSPRCLIGWLCLRASWKYCKHEY